MYQYNSISQCDTRSIYQNASARAEWAMALEHYPDPRGATDNVRLTYTLIALSQNLATWENIPAFEMTSLAPKVAFYVKASDLTIHLNSCSVLSPTTNCPPP